MGNCTCANTEERNVNRYTSNDWENETDDILADRFTHGRTSFEFISEYGVDFDNYIIEFGDDVNDYEDHFDTENSERLSNISFEGESIVSRLEQVYIEDDICGICAYNFDEDQHLPKILPCGHTICLYCIRKIARKSKFMYLECPLDRKRHKIKPQHTVRLLVNRPRSSTVSLVSSGSVRSDTLLDEDLYQSEGDSERNILLGFEQSSLVSTISDVSERSVLETSLQTEPSNYDISISGSCVNGQLTETADVNFDSPICSVQQYPDVENEVQEQEINCLDLNLDHFDESSFGMHPQPINVNVNSHVCTTRHEDHDKTCDVLCDCIDKCMRQKPGIGLKNESGKQPDIYDDERSVRSFEWVEPDYSSESDS